MGKDGQQRPRLISREEESLRWDLAYGKITKKQFGEEMKKLKVKNENLSKM